jgi:hypothetical protein
MTYDVGDCRQGGFMAEAAKLYEMPGEIGDRKVYVVREGQEPHDHPGIDISISKQDSVHWVSYGKKFRVTKLVPIDKKKDSAPEHPFYREFPDENLEHTYQINSGPARPEALDHTYEAHFHFEDGSEADPHIRVGP